MAQDAAWERGIDGGFEVQVPVLGRLAVRPDAGGQRWRFAVLEHEQDGYVTSRGAKAAAIRFARQQLVTSLEALRRLETVRAGRPCSQSPGPGEERPIRVRRAGGAGLG